MRFNSFIAAAALLTASLAAHADSFTQQLTVINGTTTDNNGNQQVATNVFSNFNPSLGTLTSIVATFQGTATASDRGGFRDLLYIYFAPTGQTSSGFAPDAGPFSFSGSLNDTTAGELSFFTGTGMSPFLLEFSTPTANVNLVGTITYNYTAAALPVAATPEPSSIALLGTGLLGALGVVARKRHA